MAKRDKPQPPKAKMREEIAKATADIWLMVEKSLVTRNGEKLLF